MDTKQERASAVRNQMNRLVVEIAVSKAIKEISKGNMPRALRRLVEIGGLLAPADTPGELSSILQSMLGDDHHPYYTLARHIVDSVDKRYLMGFGINMGFECLSCGGETIRRQHALTGRWLPWMMGVHLPLLQPEMLRVPMSLGIMTYLLAAEKASAPELAALCRAFPNAAFLLALPDQNITSALLRELEGTVNLAVFPLCRHRAFASAPLLRNAGRFYIPFFLLDEADTDRLLETADFLCPDDPDLPCALFLPDSSVPGEKADALASLIARIRLAPTHPLIPGFPTMDIPGIEQQITGDPRARFSIPEAYDFSPLLLPGQELTLLLESLA